MQIALEIVEIIISEILVMKGLEKGRDLIYVKIK